MRMQLLLSFLRHCLGTHEHDASPRLLLSCPRAGTETHRATIGIATSASRCAAAAARWKLAAFFALLIFPTFTPSPAAELTAGDVFAQTDQRRGLFVLVDPSVDLALELAQSQSILVHLLVANRNAEDIRRQLADRGVHGQVTVAEREEDRPMPLADNLAAVVVADLDRPGTPDRSELLRILRPEGKALIREAGQWRTLEKDRPGDTDDWAQYFHDGAGSDLSQDRRAGPANGLQWEAGPHHTTKIGVRVIGNTWLGVDAAGLVGRDAYNGLPRWRRPDIDIENRYAFLADSQRVYLHPRVQNTWHPPAPFMQVLDLATGEDLMTLEEGVALDAAGWIRGQHDWDSFRKDFPDDWKQRLERARNNAETLQARLDDGVLVQVAANEMVALDAQTGTRLWRQTAPAGRVNRVDRRGEPIREDWQHPLIDEGRVYTVAGENAPSWSYTHWPMGAVRSIHAFDLKSGRPLWQWDWPGGQGEPAAAYNMVISDRWLALMLRTDAQAKSQAALLLVDRQTGREHRLLRETTYGKREVGGGHSHLRALRAGDRLWINSAIGQHGGADRCAGGLEEIASCCCHGLCPLR